MGKIIDRHIIKDSFHDVHPKVNLKLSFLNLGLLHMSTLMLFLSNFCNGISYNVVLKEK